MRIVNENGLDLERKKGSKEPKSKYFIVSEGDKTELQYFQGIKRNADEIGIDNLIEIVPVENEECEFGQSHPLKKIENFNQSLEDNKFVYSKEIDKVCFIIDRDPQNFKEKQYDEFLEKCSLHGYFPYVSNPTFELFLVMHNDEILKLDKLKLLENKKVNKNKRFLETQLSKLFNCNKCNIDFNKFKNNIETAIKNEKFFSEDVITLKTELGSNVGTLLDEMIKKQKSSN